MEFFGLERHLGLSKRVGQNVPKAALLSTLLVFACEDSGLPEPSVVGTHLRFWKENDTAEVCAGTLAYMDDYVGWLKVVHDVRDGLMVDYYWFPDSPLGDHCGADFAGCTSREPSTNRAFARSIPSEHELVHAVRNEFGASHLFFEEGAAELWGAHTDRGGPNDYPGVEAAIRSLEETDHLGGQFYDLAGQFSSYLAEEYGREFVAELARQTQPGVSFEEVDAVFASAVGESLGDAIVRFENTNKTCPRSEYRDNLPACAAAMPIDCTMADSNSVVNIDVDLTCKHPRTIGPREEGVWRDFAVIVQKRTALNIVFGNDAGLPPEDFERLGEVSLAWCDSPGCDDDRFIYQNGITWNDTVDPGVYLLRVARQIDAPFSRVFLTLHLDCDQ